MILLGADVISLFPSLDTKEMADVVMKELLKTSMTFQEIDWKELATYVALNLDPGEIRKAGLERVCPLRKFNHGPRPGITTKEARKRKNKEEEDPESKWYFKKDLEPTSI